MRNTRSFITCFQVFRCISSSSTCSNLSRESRFIKKLLHGTRKSKKKWYDSNTDLRNDIGIEQTNIISAQTKRRMEVRDKLFMKHITDLMSMGEVSDIINGGIEITYVKITSNYKFVNVFWVHSTDNIFSLVSKEALQKCAKIIRHELSQLRIIGIVPPIQFVEDKRFSMEKEVEKRLATINVENDKSVSYSEEIQLDASHTDTTNQTLHMKPDTNYDSEMDESCIELPIMRHDVLGLDHYKIMSRIITSISKSKEAMQRRKEMLDTNTNIDKNSCNLISKENDFLTKKEQREIFSDFLAAKQKEKRHLYRSQKKTLQRELLNNLKENLKEEIESNYESEDYYSDERKEEIESNYKSEDYYSDENSHKFDSKL